jgi:hypothetical protein
LVACKLLCIIGIVSKGHALTVEQAELIDPVREEIQIEDAVIKQTGKIDGRGLQIVNEAESENAARQSAEASTWCRASNLPERSLNDQASAAGELAGDERRRRLRLRNSAELDDFPGLKTNLSSTAGAKDKTHFRR